MHFGSYLIFIRSLNSLLKPHNLSFSDGLRKAYARASSKLLRNYLSTGNWTFNCLSKNMMSISNSSFVTVRSDMEASLLSYSSAVWIIAWWRSIESSISRTKAALFYLNSYFIFGMLLKHYLTNCYWYYCWAFYFLSSLSTLSINGDDVVVNPGRQYLVCLL